MTTPYNASAKGWSHDHQPMGPGRHQLTTPKDPAVGMASDSPRKVGRKEPNHLHAGLLTQDGGPWSLANIVTFSTNIFFKCWFRFQQFHHAWAVVNGCPYQGVFHQGFLFRNNQPTTSGLVFNHHSGWFQDIPREYTDHMAKIIP